jgi:phage virion morphogenesis protein
MIPQVDIRYDFSAVTALVNAGLGLDLSPALREAGIYQEGSTKRNFARQSTPDGRRWVDLKPATWLRKKSGTILRETSVGVNSISHFPLNADTWAVGTNSVYMRAHQFGLPSRNLPQREFLGFSKEDIEQIDQIFQRLIAKKI